MRQINESLLNKGIILKDIKDITPKTRKKIKIYLGVDIKSYYYLLIKIEKKSKFSLTDAKELLESVSILSNINFRKNKKIIFVNSICSKSKIFLQENGWRIL
jgi:hypothetical protein